MTLELVPLATAVVALAPPVLIPNGPRGTRVIVEVTGFAVDGERLRATLKGVAAADWATVSADGTIATLDVRATLETVDGAVIFTQYSGRIDLCDGFGARPVYSTPQFETGDERYGWLNRIQVVGKGTFSGDLSRLDYELYELR